MTGNCGNVQGTPKHRRDGTARNPFSRPAKHVTSRSITIGEIKDRLTSSHIEALCKAWLPDGKRQGGWYVSCAPWREDRNPSLGVSLSTGRWKDFATGEHGDMIDLSTELDIPTTPGKYSATFRTQNADGFNFGPTLTVLIEVK